jgi:hypothetical protein
MGGYPHRARAPANQPGDGLDVQACDHPQHDDLGLQRGKLGHQRQRRLGVQAFQHHLGRVGSHRRSQVGRFGPKGGSSPGSAAPLVDRAAPRSGEHPPSPGHLIAAEADQSLHHRDPRLRGNILIHLACDHAQVSDQGRVDVKPKALERPLVATLGTGKDAGELLADHTRSIGW